MSNEDRIKQLELQNHMLQIQNQQLKNGLESAFNRLSMSGGNVIKGKDYYDDIINVVGLEKALDEVTKRVDKKNLFYLLDKLPDDNKSLENSQLLNNIMKRRVNLSRYSKTPLYKDLIEIIKKLVEYECKLDFDVFFENCNLKYDISILEIILPVLDTCGVDNEKMEEIVEEFCKRNLQDELKLLLDYNFPKISPLKIENKEIREILITY